MVQVSAAQADPASLTCGDSSKESTVTIQVWIVGLAKNLTGSEITVGLYQGLTVPPENRLDVTPQRQQAKLGESPATLRFKVRCTDRTIPGDVTFTAWIEAAPKGVKIAQADPPANGNVKIHIG